MNYFHLLKKAEPLASKLCRKSKKTQTPNTIRRQSLDF